MELPVNEIRRRCSELEQDLNHRYGQRHKITITYSASALPGIAPHEFIDTVLTIVAVESGLHVHNIRSKYRGKECVMARQVFFYIVRSSRPDLSLPTIGRSIGKDHSTVMHNIAKAKDYIQVKDHDFMQLYNKVQDKLKALNDANPNPEV